MTIRMKTVIISFLAVFLISACWNPFAPETDQGEEYQYYNSPDSAYKVLKNLEYAYLSRDIDHYLACFRDDFEFHLLECDYDDYDEDGIEDTYWGLDLEELFHESMFNSVSSIELTLSGTSQQPWTGDSTGIAQQLQRTFDLKVYLDASGTTGYRAAGSALFICRPDSNNVWYVWKWFDNSDT